jgi:hypothetical protein
MLVRFNRLAVRMATETFTTGRAESRLSRTPRLFSGWTQGRPWWAPRAGTCLPQAGSPAPQANRCVTSAPRKLHSERPTEIWWNRHAE